MARMGLRRTMRGISPVIAVIIILAVTVAIAIAVVGWIMGLFGSFGSTEAIQVLPDSYIQCVAANNATVVLHVKNSGSAAAVIYKVEVQGLGQSSDLTDHFQNHPINPGTSVWFKLYTGTNFTVTGTCTPGATYTVKIYTKAGNVYTSIVQATSG